MVSRRALSEGDGSPDDGEGPQRVVPGAGVADAPWWAGALSEGAGPRQPRHDQKTGKYRRPSLFHFAQEDFLLFSQKNQNVTIFFRTQLYIRGFSEFPGVEF